MPSKTPQFDAALDKILDILVPHARTCTEKGISKYCEGSFDVTAEDIEFYKMLRVPPPACCPTCRRQKRLAFANYSNIYRRACNVPDHTDTMISLTAPVMPWVTYDYDTYYSDAWDPRSFGREYDPRMPFLDAYRDFLATVPQPGVRRGPGCVNSDFAFYGRGMKDCYYVFGSWTSEDVMYSASIFTSRHVVDSYYTRNGDQLYNNTTTSDCYKCAYASFSSECVECDFIYDCRNCQNCFGCVNLRSKNYCWFNEQLTKEEYKKRRAEVDLGSRSVLREWKEKFETFIKENPVRATRIYQSQNVSGNDIKESKNCTFVFQVERSENVRYGQFFLDVKDSMDVAYSGFAERLYYTQNVGMNSSNVKFSFACKETRDSEFLMTCDNCTNCFGCIGLKNVSYAIGNVVYEPEEYFQRVDAIKTAMLARGEYGEFFPLSFAPYAYNSSFAHIIYPMEESEAISRRLFWQPEIEVAPAAAGVPAAALPENSSDATDELCTLAVLGEKSGKPFRLIPREIAFYKQHHIVFPSDTPYQRIIDRFKIMSNFRIHKDACFKCGTEIWSAYKTSDGYKPYCESCYLSEII